MTTPIWVGDMDLHRMLRVVEAPDLGDDGDGLPWSILHELRALIPCAWIGIDCIDRARGVVVFEQGVDLPEFRDDLDGVFWQHQDWCCALTKRVDNPVTQTSDLMTLAEWWRTPFYLDWCAPHGLDHDLQVKLPAPPGQALTLGLTRGRHDPDFSDRDRALLTLLRPHLYTAHVEVLRRRRGIPKLTDRQWQLLRLVDAGLSNTRIARHLFIAESTVRKHLENIFERLQVQSRTAALVRAFPERALSAGPDEHSDPALTRRAVST